MPKQSKQELAEQFFSQPPEVQGSLFGDARFLKRSSTSGWWQKRAARRLKARRVRRLVRHVEPWSVLKIVLLLYLCIWAVLLFVGVILWRAAVSVGLISNIETFITELAALEYFKIHGDQIFRIAAAGGLLVVLAATGLTVLAAVLFNLISDITGGVRFTVVEEESAKPRPRRMHQKRRVAMMPRPQPGTAPNAGAKPRKSTPSSARKS